MADPETTAILPRVLKDWLSASRLKEAARLRAKGGRDDRARGPAGAVGKGANVVSDDRTTDPLMDALDKVDADPALQAQREAAWKERMSEPETTTRARAALENEEVTISRAEYYDMQQEIDDLKTENARLRAEIER